MEFQVVESLGKKEIHSEDFNCVFNKESKTLAVWGRTPEETPLWCPFGPLVAYIELSETTSNMFKLLMEQLGMTKSLCLVILINDNYADNIEEYQKVGAEYGVSIIMYSDFTPYHAGSLFTLYINKEGVILTHPYAEIGIPIQIVNNMVKDVWYDKVFVIERYERTLERKGF